MRFSEQETDRLIERGADLARLTARGLTPDQWSPRFRHSIEIAAGRREAGPGLQQPTAFHYPDLPQTRFYDPGQFG